ncbi:MAG: hypothetical protein HYZ49_12580 [Chloroflexi bacterium]|nr:hypothetical protein [Chloroflexota bacterium]
MTRLNLKTWIAVLAAIAVMALGLIVWRFTAPVEVRIEADVTNLPFEVEIIPPVVYAKPGEMVRVVYRIRNTNLSPLDALGRVEVDPNSATDQIQIFITQCIGLNAFQSNYPQDFEVLFRVQPAGLTGQGTIILRHVFESATLR